MVVIAETLYGDGGLICYPSGVGGEIYFADNDSVGGVAKIRSYHPVELDNNVFPDPLIYVLGMNPVFNETKLYLHAYDGAANIVHYLHDPVGGTWTSSVTLSMGLPYACSISGNAQYLFVCEYGSGAGTVSVWDTVAHTWTKITTDGVQILNTWSPVDMVLATSRDGVNVGKLYLYTTDNYGTGSTSSNIFMYTIPATPPYTGGSWSNVTPLYLSGSTALAVALDRTCHCGLATITTGGTSDDDVVARFWDGYTLPNAIMLKHITGTNWIPTGESTTLTESQDQPTATLGEVNGKLFYGYNFGEIPVGVDVEIVMFVSSAVITSSWVNTTIPALPENKTIYNIGSTTGTSAALYLPMTIRVAPLYDRISSHLMESTFSAGGTTSTCDITTASPGDIYNIGGVSNEPTTHIEFTMWDNSAYGKGKSR
jgi:hypothetical protein